MPLPGLRGNGTLPPGVHKVTLEEVKAAFGRSSPRRVELMTALEECVRRARRAGIRRILLGGSFVTRKRKPRDIDVIFAVEDKYLDRLEAGDSDASWIESASKADPSALVDAFLAMDGEEWDSWCRFFGGEVSRRRKGVLEVNP